MRPCGYKNDEAVGDDAVAITFVELPG